MTPIIDIITALNALGHKCALDPDRSLTDLIRFDAGYNLTIRPGHLSADKGKYLCSAWIKRPACLHYSELPESPSCKISGDKSATAIAATIARKLLGDIAGQLSVIAARIADHESRQAALNGYIASAAKLGFRFERDRHDTNATEASAWYTRGNVTARLRLSGTGKVYADRVSIPGDKGLAFLTALKALTE